MGSSILLVAPEVEPVLVADAMLALAIDEPDMAPKLASQLLAAREEAEYKTGRALITQTRRLRLRSWPESIEGFGPAILLDRPPVKEVVALNYWAVTNEWLSVQTSGLEVVEIDQVTWVLISLSGSWPELGAKFGHRIHLDFKCGYGDAGESVPEPIRRYITSSAGFALLNPEGVGDAPNEYIDRQLDGWRVWL